MASPRRADLDFSLMEDLAGGSVFWSLHPSVADPLEAALPETALWLHGALYLASLIGWSPKDTSPPLRERVARSAAAFRGFLAEFARVDHVVAREFQTAGFPDAPTLIRSRDPRLHLFRELRNLELHLVPSKMASREADFRIGFEEGESTFTLNLLLVEDLSAERLGKLQNARYYGRPALAQMVQWLERNQQTWGISSVIRHVVECYARYAYNEYALHAGLARLPVHPAA